MDSFLVDIEKLNDLKKREIKIFYNPKLYLKLKEIPKEPNQLLKYSKEYLALKNIPLESTKFNAKDYLDLKQIFYPMPENYAKSYLKLKEVSKILKIIVNKSHQRMYVYLGGKHLYTFKVSTARRGYWTPTGVYRPYSLERMHYSRKYHNSPMPWSVFFKGGYAIHGTNSISRLGAPASHGCVRLHPSSAKKVFYLIRKFGKYNTRIIIKG
jgi:hypothetical protein